MRADHEFFHSCPAYPPMRGYRIRDPASREVLSIKSKGAKPRPQVCCFPRGGAMERVQNQSLKNPASWEVVSDQGCTTKVANVHLIGNYVIGVDCLFVCIYL